MTEQHNNSRLHAKGLCVGYDQNRILEQLNLAIPEGSFTAIIGPNGCGKTTLLRSLCRLLKPNEGCVYLDGKDIHQQPAKAVAKQLGLLPQSATAPDGIKVSELVARGRYPHQSMLRQWSHDDAQAVAVAMDVTGISKLAPRPVSSLSGGQRQRVWVAMALAQQTPILLLDEPTTFLDIAHQIELMELFRELNLSSGRTLVAVLHDLNHACRYASHMIAMGNGRIINTGNPREIVNQKLIADVFNLDCVIIDDPVSHTPLVIPKGNFPQPATSASTKSDSSSASNGPTDSNDSGETISS
jgi:ABC-type cobalamin/Fe3+-siderophores transport system ATPase subunit